MDKGESRFQASGTIGKFTFLPTMVRIHSVRYGARSMRFRKWFVPAIFALMILLIVWLAASDQSPVRLQNTQNNPMLWEIGWQAENEAGALRPITLPQKLKAGETVLVNTVPSTLQTTQALYIKTDYQQVSASVDGEAVSVSGVASETGDAVSYDLPWSTLEISRDMAGKTIRLTLSGTGSKPYAEVYSIRLGKDADVRLALLGLSLPSVILSLLILLVALTLFAFGALQARRHRESMNQGYFYLLAFIAIAGVWFYTDTDISGTEYVGNRAFYFVTLMSYLLMPVPYLLFIGCAVPSARRLSVTLGALLSVNALVELAIVTTAVFPPWAGIVSSHGLLAIACLALLLRSGGKRHTWKANGELFIGVVYTSAAGLVSLAAFYLTPLGDNAGILRFGVVTLLLSLAVSMFRTNVDIVAKAGGGEQLRIREEEYRIAVRQSEKHVLRFDVGTRTLLRGDDPSPLYNAGEDLPDMPDSFVAAGNVAEESVPDIRIFFSDMIAGKPNGSCAASLRNRDGSYSWYRIDYAMIYSDRNEPLQAVVSFLDISEQHQRELAYQKWKQRYAGMSAGSMSLYECNLTRDTPVGEAGGMLAPLPEGAKRTLRLAVNHLAEKIALPDDSRRFRAFLDRDRLLEAFAHGIRNDDLEFKRVDADHRERWTVASIQLIADPYSGNVQFSLLLQDEDEAKRNELKTRDCSNSDPLTGLLNRAAFEEQLTLLLEQTDPAVTHALLAIDLDGFKRVNDTFGHQFGDRVLMDIANSLRAMMHNDDLIGRVGGDEFMVCLKNILADTGFLEKRASFICQVLNMKFGNDVTISGSVGIALYPRDGRTFGTLFQKADKALHYAKHNGRNRYIFYRGALVDHADTLPSPIRPYTDPSESEAAPAPPVEERRTLLLVDETEEAVSSFMTIFQDEYRLLTARSGEQCLALLERDGATISAMLLDLAVAGTSGLEVLSRMQRDAVLSTIPVIVTSTDAETKLGLEAVELGAMDFVSKPFDPRVLKIRVQSAIRKREAEELRAQNRYLLVQKSDESRHQNELRYIAEHDPLTNICNKAAFYRKTKLMLDKAPDIAFVMIAFDIEKFRLINDIFGHGEGDRLLRYIAQRMQTLFADSGTYSRIDADNFALCVPYDPQLLRKRMAECDRELKEYDLPFEVLLVYGLYIIDDRTLPVSIIHDRAEMAKRTVKGNYVNRYAYYDDHLRKTLLDELDIVNDMNGALQKRQFEIYLQPKCKLATGEIVGAEALVRWNHPTRGVLLPGAFVSIFERNGFIMKMDVYVWEQVCALIRGWMDRYGGKPPIPVSMNISRADIYNPALVKTLCSMAERYGVPHKYIELEITESAYAEDPKLLSELISALRNESFTVEMDDFGSAYSSLNMLKEIQVDLLKLDMRFLYGNDPDGRGGTILSSVVRMARYLALPVVAEGVETVEQCRFLASIGCTIGQGFLFYRPMPVGDFERLLAARPQKPFRSVGDIFPESAVRRVWSIDGDFNLMLSTIPCAASLCEMSGTNIELLRINQEYLAATGDRAERVYQSGTSLRKLTTGEAYQNLLALFKQAFDTQGVAEGTYRHLGEDGSQRAIRLKVKFLSGDAVRSLFFVTYLPIRAETEPQARGTPAAKGLATAPEFPRAGGTANVLTFPRTGDAETPEYPRRGRVAAMQGRGMAPMQEISKPRAERNGSLR
jgi:diguanylate cyclase (GGDEF)-like protein